MRFGALAAVLALTVASAALAAPGTANSGRASGSDTTAQQLDTRTHQALLSLYALDSQLQAWRARLASLESAAAAIKERQASLRAELGAATDVSGKLEVLITKGGAGTLALDGEPLPLKETKPLPASD